MWDKNEVSRLRSRKAWLQWMVEKQIIPGSIKDRANGLLGDLYFKKGDERTALDYYLVSLQHFEGLWIREGVEKSRSFPDVIGDLYFENSEFRDGATAEFEKPFSSTVLNDSDMALLPPQFDPSLENSHDNFLEVSPLSESDQKLVSNLFPTITENPDWESMEKLCTRNRERLDSFQHLGQRFVLAPPTMSWNEDLVRLSRCIELVFINSLVEGKKGNRMEAEDSLDVAYKMLRYLDQNPTLETGRISARLREKIADYLLSDMGNNMSLFFREDYISRVDALDNFATGQYQSEKLNLDHSGWPDNAIGKRVLHRVKERRRDFWRDVRNRKEPSLSIYDLPLESKVEFFFENRQFYYRYRTSEKSDGAQYIKNCEELLVDICSSKLRCFLGFFGDSLERVRNKELSILAERK